MSQSRLILLHLQSGRTITALEALHLYGCLRLAARIADLKRDGHPIRVDEENDDATGKRYARYSLVKYEQLELAL